MAFQMAYHTDVGLRKKTNQDGLLLKTAKTPKGRVGLFAVSDGMGGLSSGELASATVIRGLSEWFDNELPEILESGVEEESIPVSLDYHIKSINEKILQFGDKEKIKLGTTITAMLIVYNRYYIIQIGDSRAYRIDDSIERLTTDQTLVVRELLYGNITEEQAKIDPRRNILLQCIGATRDLEVVILHGQVKEGALYLLCTDGFYNKLEDTELQFALNPETFHHDGQLREKVIELVELAKQRREMDNISCIAVKVS
jgi:serine/threonine protein phosphatase PrpC